MLQPARTNNSNTRAIISFNHHDNGICLNGSTWLVGSVDHDGRGGGGNQNKNQLFTAFSSLPRVSPRQFALKLRFWCLHKNVCVTFFWHRVGVLKAFAFNFLSFLCFLFFFFFCMLWALHLECLWLVMPQCAASLAFSRLNPKAARAAALEADSFVIRSRALFFYVNTRLHIIFLNSEINIPNISTLVSSFSISLRHFFVLFLPLIFGSSLLILLIINLPILLAW